MKAPIRIVDEVFLVDADHELICRTESATPEELAYIVHCVNMHDKLKKIVGSIPASQSSAAIVRAYAEAIKVKNPAGGSVPA